MAPSVNLSDDIAELSRLTGQLFRLALARKSPSALHEAAAAAGMSPAQATQFMSGLLTLPPRQTVAFCNNVLERQRLADESYTLQIRTTRPPVPSETTLEGATAKVAELGKTYPSWRFSLPEGLENFGSDRPVKLLWSAEHDTWPDVRAADAWELEQKIRRVEEALKQNKHHGNRLIPTEGTT